MCSVLCLDFIPSSCRTSLVRITSLQQCLTPLRTHVVHHIAASLASAARDTFGARPARNPHMTDATIFGLPQPLIAVPVFMFARHFIFWRSVGLGFAAGSMIWVTCFELLADAIKVSTLVHRL